MPVIFKVKHRMDSFFGFYNDNGEEINPDLHPKPQLCLSCKKNDDPNEEILCTLNRLDQLGESDFSCFAFQRFN